MALDAVSNFVRGTTDEAVDSTQTTISVADASIFPDPATDGEFNVVIWDANNFPRPDQDSDVEILRVTGVDTGADELTVTRAQEMTSAASHPSGAAVHLSPTAKMFSDIETEYTAQGENFDGEGTSEFSNLASVDTDNLSPTAKKDVNNSVHAALSEGNAVAFRADRSMMVVDPRDYADDSAAMQAAADYIADNGSTGTLYHPQTRAGGGQWSYPRTVTVGNANDVNQINVKFVGFTGNNVRVTTTINDGSPIFHMVGDTANSNLGRRVTFEGGNFNIGDNDAGIVKFEAIEGFICRDLWATNTGGDAIDVDGCVNFGIDWVFLKSFTQGGTGRGIVFRDSNNINKPSDFFVGPHVHILNHPTESLKSIDGVRDAVIGGHYGDGATGRAHLDFGHEDDFVTITPNATIGRTENGAHGVYFDGESANIQPLGFQTIDGDAIHIGPNATKADADTFVISNEIEYSDVIGDAIHIETDGPGRVPYESSVQGTVAYPGGPWQNLEYLDGWAKASESTLTLTGGAGTGEANAQSTLDDFALPTSGETAEVKVTFRPQNPSFNANYGFARPVPQYTAWDESTGNVDVTVRTWWTTDPGSGNDVTLDYTVWYRER